MRVGNFSVLIPEGVERDSGHVAVEHGRQYTIRLLNHDHRRCDAEVTIDGKPVGGFRLHARGSLTLERAPHDPGRFTFYAAGTAEADRAGEAGVDAPDRGLVVVRFVPERRPAQPVHQVKTIARPIGLTAFSGDGTARGGWPEEKTSGGITGLSGHSAQQFVTVPDLDRAEDEAVTVSLRLVVLDAGPRPLRPAGDRANPVPAPV